MLRTRAHTAQRLPAAEAGVELDGYGLELKRRSRSDLLRPAPAAGGLGAKRRCGCGPVVVGRDPWWAA